MHLNQRRKKYEKNFMLWHILCGPCVSLIPSPFALTFMPFLTNSSNISIAVQLRKTLVLLSNWGNFFWYLNTKKEHLAQCKCLGASPCFFSSKHCLALGFLYIGVRWRNTSDKLLWLGLLWLVYVITLVKADIFLHFPLFPLLRLKENCAICTSDDDEACIDRKCKYLLSKLVWWFSFSYGMGQYSFTYLILEACVFPFFFFEILFFR